MKFSISNVSNLQSFTDYCSLICLTDYPDLTLIYLFARVEDPCEYRVHMCEVVFI